MKKGERKREGERQGGERGRMKVGDESTTEKKSTREYKDKEKTDEKKGVKRGLICRKKQTWGWTSTRIVGGKGKGKEGAGQNNLC
jgi:hypothetical protein